MRRYLGIMPYSVATPRIIVRHRFSWQLGGRPSLADRFNKWLDKLAKALNRMAIASALRKLNSQQSHGVSFF